MVKYPDTTRFTIWGTLKITDDTLSIIDFNEHNFITYAYRVHER